MSVRRLKYTILLAALILSGAFFTQAVKAQASNPTRAEVKRDDETNLEIQLSLLVGSNDQHDNARLPSSLETVARALHASLPFTNYRLEATLLNRVRNGSHLSVRSVGGAPPVLVSSVATSVMTPNFYEFDVHQVSITADESQQDTVRLDGFRFGSRIALQLGVAGANNSTAPNIQYESTGITTDISMRAGEPVVVGTLNAGANGDVYIVVVMVKRASTR